MKSDYSRMMFLMNSAKKNKARLFTNDMAINAILCTFVFRPLIDLPYDNPILFGLNLAGIIAMLTILFGLLWLIKHPRLRVGKIECFLLIYILIAICSTAVHLTSFSDYAYVLRLLSSAVFLFCVAPSINKQTLIKCYKVFIIVSLVPIAISFMQALLLLPFTYFDHSLGRTIGRASGGYRHPSSLVRVVLFSVIYTMYLLENDWKKGNKRIAAYLYISVSIASVIISYLRSGYFSLVIILFSWFVLKYKGNIGKLLSRVLIIGIIAIIVFVIIYKCGLLQVDIKEFSKFFSVRNFIKMDNSGNSRVLNLRGRSGYIDKLVSSLKFSPVHVILFGNGIDISSYNGIDMTIADMNIIRIIWNCGFIGLAIWCIYIVGFFVAITRKRKTSTDFLFVNMGICLFIFYFLWGITKESTTQPNIMSHLFLTCGFIYHNKYI